MYKLLQRQLKKIGFQEKSITLKQFLMFIRLVDKSYRDCEDERHFLEHTLEVSSREMRGLYEALQKKSATRLAQSEARYRTLAQRDTLTGIANRYALEEALKKEIAVSKRHHRKFALLFMDLDNFKSINDTLGHDFGDKLLQEVSKRIGAQLRSEDVFARLGGDEFVIVFTNIDVQSLSPTIEKILHLFQTPWDVGETEKRTLNVSTSMGVVVYPRDGKDAIELLKHADIAMYKAKETGRNTFSFFTQELNEKVHFNMALEMDMSRAIRDNQFMLLYQPKAEVKTGRIIGAEALIRWKHPEFGLLTPDQFIPLAEGNGQILDIGAWAIREAAKAIERFNALDQKSRLHVSVNISLKQLQTSQTYDLIQESIRNIDGAQLTKDITFAIDILNTIRSLGVRVAMDDFGTGYSSLSNLTKFPINGIKIDRSFISKIPHDGHRGEKSLVGPMIMMAKTLDLCTVAEGVEKEYQLDYLNKKHCKYYQGYLLAKPMSEDQYVAFLAHHLCGR